MQNLRFDILEVVIFFVMSPDDYDAVCDVRLIVDLSAVVVVMVLDRRSVKVFHNVQFQLKILFTKFYIKKLYF